MGTTGQSITLANSIIGVGILAMPFCFQQCGVLLATLILLSMGLVSRLSCYFLLKSAIITRRRNFEFLAFHVFGPAGKMAVETGIIGFLMGTCIAYFVVVGDLGPQIIAKLLNINQSDILRTSIMVIVSLVCVLPLGLLRNVDSLSNVSAATIAFYFCLVIKVVAEATSQLVTSTRPTIAMWRPAGVLQCVPIFSMALFCQTQLFEIFESMPSLSLEKMCLVTKNAINICTGVYFTLGLFGYMAFGSQEISGNILMSLSPTWASDVIKLGFVMSLAFSFPLIIFPCRASLYSFLYRKVQSSHHDHIINHSIPENTFRLMTVGIVGLALVVSLLLPNVELVLGLLGATIGVLICVVFPAACFVNVTFKDTNERVLAKFVVVLGLIILVLGTYANLQAAENTRDKYDERYITKERIDEIVEDFFQQKAKSEALSKPSLIENGHEQKDKLIEGELIKDSEIQPPNPVPPESQSIEKKPVKDKEDKQIKEILPIIENTLNKMSETHPRNIQSKLNGENVAINNKVVSEQVNKIKDMKDEIKEEDIGAVKRDDTDMISKEKEVNNQEKIDIMKQQQLMETIKQHGKEQKELIKEQKEILNKILETKKELHESKKEVDSNEAKKIAVESIQKIANMAIQSIGGVTDKPGNQLLPKQPELLEDIANEAVHEIAKKAAETLDAIKHIDDSSKNMNHVVDKTNNDKIKQNKPEANIITDTGNLEQERNNKQDKLIISNSEVANQFSADIKPISIDNRNKNNEQQKKDTLHKNLNDADITKDRQEYVAVELSQKTAAANKKVIPPLVETNQKQENDPQLNKQNNMLNVPLPIVLNDKERLNIAKQTLETNAKPKVDNNYVDINKKNNNDVITNRKQDEVVKEEGVFRQKREVIDCTDLAQLKPEDKQICENLVNKPIIDDKSDSILPKIDLAEVGLANSFPMSLHHVRSLKSINEDKNR